MSRRFAWALAGAGLLATAVGAALRPTAFAYAWLAALTAWVGWPLGCMGLLLTHALTGGRWGQALRPQWLAGMNTLPLLLPVLLFLLPQLQVLYPWARPHAAQHLHNGIYLNLPFFAARGLCYLVVWFGLAQLIRRARRQPDPQAALARIAPAGLILLGLTITYAVIDTTMSLNPDFFSSAYGLIALAGMGLLAMSVSLFAATFVRTPDHAEQTDAGTATEPRGKAARIDAPLRDELGQLLLGLVLLWVYLDFVQALIIWQSDLYSDAPWYVLRTRGGWGAALTVIAITHFALPFFLLIWPPLRRSRRAIRAVAAVLILAQITHSWWLVLPAARAGFCTLDVTSMVGLLALAAAVALRDIRPPRTLATAGAADG